MMHSIAAILIWRFEDAPVELRALSINGGDEDWLAAIPPEFSDDNRWEGVEIPWMEHLSFDSMGSPNVYHPDSLSSWHGWTIVIGSHA